MWSHVQYLYIGNSSFMRWLSTDLFSVGKKYSWEMLLSVLFVQLDLLYSFLDRSVWKWTIVGGVHLCRLKLAQDVSSYLCNLEDWCCIIYPANLFLSRSYSFFLVLHLHFVQEWLQLQNESLLISVTLHDLVGFACCLTLRDLDDLHRMFKSCAGENQGRRRGVVVHDENIKRI